MLFASESRLGKIPQQSGLLCGIAGWQRFSAADWLFGSNFSLGKVYDLGKARTRSATARRANAPADECNVRTVRWRRSAVVKL
jgi:hypothetical protein